VARVTSWSFVAIVWMVAGCVRAQFVPVDGPDAGKDAEVDGPACLNPTRPVSGCQSKSSGPCDPVCQSGTCSWCGQKCSLDKSGAEICTSRGGLEAGRTCTIIEEGTAQQHDECRAGAICLAPNTGNLNAYCFVLCRGSVDCPGNVACAPRPLGRSASAMVCDLEYTVCDSNVSPGCCDPLASEVSSNGCANGRFCYLVAPDPAGHSRTMCEYATGGKGRGEACSSSRECLERYVCVPSGAEGSGTCQRVCSDGHPCNGSTCVPLGSEFGYCPL
jgi:hypothetical protein